MPENPSNDPIFMAYDCPNCGGKLQIPTNRDKVLCMYCGTEIIIPKLLRNAFNNINIEHYVSLLETAVQAKNYEEVIRYSDIIIDNCPEYNKGVLAIAWGNKGLATGFLSTQEGQNINILGMLTYIQKSFEIDKDSLNKEIYSGSVAWIVHSIFISLMKWWSKWIDEELYKSDQVSDYDNNILRFLDVFVSRPTQKKNLVKSCGQTFVKKYESDLILGLKFSWELAQTKNSAEMILSMVSDVITSNVLDGETRNRFVILVRALINNIYEMYPNLQKIPVVK